MVEYERLSGTAADRWIVKKLAFSLSATTGETRPPGELAAQVGRFFLGSPYAAGALERPGSERLVVDLRRFDCFTFLENTVALACVIGEGKGDYSSYTAELEKIRYRGGRLNGYASRLHYFSDWLRDNQRKGILKDITRELGGRPLPGLINYMTKNRRSYPALDQSDIYQAMRLVERRCSRRCLFHIPKRELRRAEEGIRDGDLIGITTAIEGLDVTHAGLAVRVNKRIHLLHASSAAGQVLVSPETLARYLTANKDRTGIIVGRLREL